MKVFFNLHTETIIDGKEHDITVLDLINMHGKT